MIFTFLIRRQRRLVIRDGIAAGRADDLLTNLILAVDLPILVVPAMHPQMWLDPATQANVQILRSRGFSVMEPEVGRLTGDDIGPGRFPETASIIENFEKTIGAKKDLLGRRVLVTAGGTREAIDPVRYIGNRSSGRQGAAVASSAQSRGADVTLILANSQLSIEESKASPLYTSDSVDEQRCEQTRGCMEI